MIAGKSRLLDWSRRNTAESPGLFAELKRRNVYRVAVAYLVVGWLLVQIATQVFPFFEIPGYPFYAVCDPTKTVRLAS